MEKDTLTTELIRSVKKQRDMLADITLLMSVVVLFLVLALFI